MLCWPIAWRAKVALLVALGAHAYVRRASPPERIVRGRTGLWALPESGRTGLGLSPASRYGAWWVELRLVGAHGAYRRLLCRDQLPQEDWRRLQLALRRPGRQPDLS